MLLHRVSYVVCFALKSSFIYFGTEVFDKEGSYIASLAIIVFLKSTSSHFSLPSVWNYKMNNFNIYEKQHFYNSLFYILPG